MPPFPFRCRISSEKWGQRIRCFTRNSQGLEHPAAPVCWSRARWPTFRPIIRTRPLPPPRALRQPGAPFPRVQGVHHGEYPQLPDLSADAALPQGAGGGRFRSECLHRKRLSGLQQLPENLPPSVRHHPRRIPRTAPDNGALKAAAGEYENFSQKGLTFYPLCGIILEQSARAAEKQKSKYRGVEQSGSSSGS
mgnify:CR=1 FL=1